MEEVDAVATEKKVPDEKSHKTSHESLFGVLVMMMVIVLLVLLASYGGWFLYHGVKNGMNDNTQPSIADIPRMEKESNEKEPVSSAEKESVSIEKEKTESSAVANKKIAIKVLNGGLTKGAAATVVNILKVAGYTTLSTGNSTGNYFGMTIYFTAPATQGDADAVKNVLLGKYPMSTVKASVSSNADTTTSPVTVVIGK